VISRNFAAKVWHVPGAARRIKSSHVVLRWAAGDHVSVAAITLAEAEGVRRWVHSAAGVSQQVALCLPSGQPIDGAPPAAAVRQFALLRLFNGEMRFTCTEVVALLDALQAEPPARRQQAFEALLRCRRCSSHAWRGTSVVAVLTEQDSTHFKKMLQVSRIIRSAWMKGGQSAQEVFRKVDADGNGLLSQGELIAALQELGGDQVTSSDMRQLALLADISRDGQLDYQEFVKGLLWLDDSS